MRRSATAAALTAALVAVSGCARPAQPRSFVVTIAQMGFGPTPSGLQVGDHVVWVNSDIFEHSATAKDGGFDVDLAPGARASTVMTHAGRIDFYCRYHPGMTGRLLVTG